MRSEAGNGTTFFVALPAYQMSERQSRKSLLPFNSGFAGIYTYLERVGGFMRRFAWLRCLLALALIAGMAAPTAALATGFDASPVLQAGPAGQGCGCDRGTGRGGSDCAAHEKRRCGIPVRRHRNPLLRLKR